MTASATQEQRQEQLVTINVQSSGDPLLEHRILSGVHSVGRQLAALSRVVGLLLDHSVIGRDSDTDADAVRVFRGIQADIEWEKSLRRPRQLLAELSRPSTNEAERRQALEALRAWAASELDQA